MVGHALPLHCMHRVWACLCVRLLCSACVCCCSAFVAPALLCLSCLLLCLSGFALLSLACLALLLCVPALLLPFLSCRPRPACFCACSALLCLRSPALLCSCVCLSLAPACPACARPALLCVRLSALLVSVLPCPVCLCLGPPCLCVLLVAVFSHSVQFVFHFFRALSLVFVDVRPMAWHSDVRPSVGILCGCKTLVAFRCKTSLRTWHSDVRPLYGLGFLSM